MAAWEEVENLRALELVGQDWWRGTRSFLTYSANAPGLMQSFRNQQFPNVPGSNAPRMRRVRAVFNPDGQRGLAMLLCWYESLRQPKKARILARTAERPYKQILDTAGRTIQGPDQHSGKGGKPDGVHAWQLLSGDVSELNPYGVIRVETAYFASKFSYMDVFPIIGAVNDRDLPNLGNAARGTMRLIRVGSDWQWGDELIYINYDLQWSGPDETWNERDVSQRGLWIIQKQPRFDLDPATDTLTELSAGKRDMRIFLPGRERYATKDAGGNVVYKIRDSKAEARSLFKEKNFGVLASLRTF